MKAFFFGILSMMLSQITWSQSYKIISIDSLVENIKAKNLSLKINEKSLYISQAQYKESLGAILPQISISHEGFRTNNPVIAFGSRLNQGIFKQSDFDVNTLNNPDAITNFTTTFKVEQPLLNLDKLIKRQALKQSYNAQASQNDYIKSALIMKSKIYYMQLQLAYQSQKTVAKALDMAQKNYTQTQNFYNEGLVQKADLLAVKIRLSEVENQNTTIIQDIKNLSDQIKQIMQDESEILLKPTDSLKMLDLWNNNQTETIKIQNTSDVKAFEFRKQSIEKLHKAERLSFLPQLNAFGQFQYFDDDIFGTSSNNYFFGAQLKWNLFKGYTRFARLKKTKAEAEKINLEKQNYIQQKENNIKKSIRAIEVSEQQMNTVKIAVEQSNEAYRIIKNRYEEGLEKTTDLLSADIRYTKKKLAYLKSVYQYNYNVLYYQFLTEN